MDHLVTKIGILSDMHLPENGTGLQYAFLQGAIEKFREEGVKTILCLGDVTRYGELEAWENYLEFVKEFEHYEVLGNSDVRDADTKDYFINEAVPICFKAGRRQFFGVHTPNGEITSQDRENLGKAKVGDVIFLHHYIESMQEESGQWLTKLAERIPLTIIHGHGHRTQDYYVNQTHVFGVKGLDPDKAIGDFPCVGCLEVSDKEVLLKEYPITLPMDSMLHVREYFGLSCVDNAKDIAYAAEHGIKYIELRCNGDWKPDYSVLPLIESWRKQTNGYLSVHMPNLYFKEGSFAGTEQWEQALDYALQAGADSFTMHPPRVSVKNMPTGEEVWNTFLTYYTLVANSVSSTVRLGVENLHMERKEILDENRGFGYTPEEVSSWIDAINLQLGENRVGHVLDVGHARNNGKISEKYPISEWYMRMGNKTVAYHIHQVVPEDGTLRNHRAIENWFGPMINYTSFIYAWEKNILNHVPVFLEVKGYENYEKSIHAYQEIIKVVG